MPVVWPRRLQQIRANLVRLHEETEGRLRIATGCSGTDLIVRLLVVMTELWQEFFGLSFRVEHVWSCDRGTIQQKFISQHMQPKCLFESMEEVASSPEAHDILSGKPQPVESCFGFATGIECDTLSMLNNSKRIGESVVEKGEGKTGTSAKAIKDIMT